MILDRSSDIDVQRRKSTSKSVRKQYWSLENFVNATTKEDVEAERNERKTAIKNELSDNEVRTVAGKRFAKSINRRIYTHFETAKTRRDA